MRALAAAALAAVATSHGHAPPAHVAAGARLGTLTIPRIHLVATVQQGGWDLYTAPWPAALAPGPAHYPNTAFPWQRGTVALAGHRTTNTRPFLHLNDLRRRDLIVLRTRWGTYRYRVYRMAIIKPTDIHVLTAPRRGHQLLLTACHPPRQATYRLAVWARLVP